MNMELLKYMLDGILLSLLLGVTGLLVWFHLRLNKLMDNYGKMPKLSEIFGDNLSEARAGVQSISDKIGDQVMEANKTLQEVNYVLDHAEKLMQQFDERLDAAKASGIRPRAQIASPAQPAKVMQPVVGKQVVLPKDVAARVEREPVERQVAPAPKTEKQTISRQLGGVAKSVRAFRPQQIANSKKDVIFKNTSRSGGASAYGAAASAIQRSGGGVPLATEQEESLMRALEERL